jgi:5-formyltetrahydrofolate cyclo-ligase
MTKSELRLKYKKLRSEISASDLENWSVAIANTILKMDIWQQQYYHIFLPITAQNEINTEFLLHILAGKDKEIVVSSTDFTTIKMTHILLTDSTNFIVNRYGVPEPNNGLEVPVSKIEVVFLPLLAYDKTGHRVGYGKGIYDQFLSECPEALKIGLSFFEPEPHIADIFEKDIPLDFCVTPNSIYEF